MVYVLKLVVRMTGVEPARLSAIDPKSIVYANFTTSAYFLLLKKS